MVTAQYGSTHVERLEAGTLAELRALVARTLPTLTWRHHAIGALQGYVAEDCEPEVRVHIWHPDLVRVDPDRDAGRPHDHRFDLKSTVLVGSIGHEELHVEEDPAGDLLEYTVQHARKGPAPLAATGRRLRARRVSGTIEAGYAYWFDARQYHRSFVPGPAVTLVTKFDQKSDPARVLFPVGVEPVFGVHPFDPREAERYVAEAIASLKGGA
jgi:hypothetical protein